MRINVNLTHIFTFDIRFLCTYLLFKSNIHVFAIVILLVKHVFDKRQFTRDANTTNHVQERAYEIYVVQNRKLREFER